MKVLAKDGTIFYARNVQLHQFANPPPFRHRFRNLSDHAFTLTLLHFQCSVSFAQTFGSNSAIVERVVVAALACMATWKEDCMHTFGFGMLDANRFMMMGTVAAALAPMHTAMGCRCVQFVAVK